MGLVNFLLGPRLSDLASSQPIVRRVNSILEDAANRGVSDLHFEPIDSGLLIRRRIDGWLEDYETMGNTTGAAVISRFKILAGLDIAERRRPQDGRFSFPVGGRNLDLRISTVPMDHGESVVVRLLDPSVANQSYAGLGFENNHINLIKQALQRRSGIILVAGPTGSGKTTSLYAFLRELNDGSRKILTVEDPIEYRLQGIQQSQIDPGVGITFATQLRSFLRHDPDVMVVGEMRDLETAKIAVQAALTGHLVLSTLHTNDAPSAMTRLRDLGIDDYLIASTVKLIISQRLVGKLCATCLGTGCFNCDGKGQKGRIAVSEALSFTPDIQEAVHNGASVQQVLSLAHDFTSMSEDAEEKVRRQQISPEELQQAFSTESLFQ